MKSLVYKEEIKRDQQAIPCPECNGYADRVDCTKEEIEGRMNCGKGYECCVRAFVCRVCKKRIIGKANAPEMTYDY